MSDAWAATVIPNALPIHRKPLPRAERPCISDCVTAYLPHYPQSDRTCVGPSALDRQFACRTVRFTCR